MKEQWRILFQLFWTFFKIAPSTFGGGFAMIPLIETEVVEKKKWLKSEDVADVFALSQSVPGAVAINSASFIGHRISGVKGAIAALIGVSLPTFLIVLSLGLSYFLIAGNAKLEAAFMAIRPAIVAIIVYAAIKVAKTAIVDKFTFFISVIGVPLLFFLHPILAIVTGAALGVVSLFVKRKWGHEKPANDSKDQDKPENKPEYYMGAGI